MFVPLCGVVVPREEVEHNLYLYDGVGRARLHQADVGEVAPGGKVEVLDSAERHHLREEWLIEDNQWCSSPALRNFDRSKN